MATPQSDASTAQQATGLGCLVRLGWLVVGHGLMLLSALFIYEWRGGFVLSAADAVYWGRSQRVWRSAIWT